ncbi:MAG: cell division protein FtsZ [Gammaproteobacteria bacterium]|jgi:cell division protein FtsZ|nr:cell division protein FtsZ [Gammaproteobacteria bacterium]MBT5204650.1 cell division protein FtsZ [Gammaproteobacteria bacterium]MBT5603009.1 cell division protein FtsZ [Gammaproteobacteria bacterium]MBT6243979.1 cell division protein FtsZ [Gammaproteobacteria bacterium]
MFELVDNKPQHAVIKVIGVGGGGGNAVQHMMDHHIEGVDFVCANTDAQALQRLTARTLLQLGTDLTKGLGAGANPVVGKEAALEDRERISEVLDGADMVFITAGMGGGTGTGAAPIVANIAKEMGILTVAVVTKPFPFEGRKRMQIAENGIAELAECVDSLITVPNEKLLSIMGPDAPLLEAFAAVDNVLLGAVQGIADLIIRPGIINVDFADVRTVMSEMGMAMMGSGLSVGADRASKAAQAAVRSPLLEDVDFNGARGILVNIAAGVDITLTEFSQVGATIEDFASENATVVIGTVIDPEMGEEMRVTVVATGLGLTLEERSPMELGEKMIRKIAGDGDYGEFDTPTIIRNGPLKGEGQEEHSDRPKDLDYLDIPAFLRRQAD